jgi:uncharacterized protein YlxW (UPF0749 family)
MGETELRALEAEVVSSEMVEQLRRNEALLQQLTDIKAQQEKLQAEVAVLQNMLAEYRARMYSIGLLIRP